nr:uncharacterized protein LOC106025283 [Cavia porcellus]
MPRVPRGRGGSAAGVAPHWLAPGAGPGLATADWTAPPPASGGHWWAHGRGRGRVPRVPDRELLSLIRAPTAGPELRGSRAGAPRPGQGLPGIAGPSCGRLVLSAAGLRGQRLSAPSPLRLPAAPRGSGTARPPSAVRRAAGDTKSAVGGDGNRARPLPAARSCGARSGRQCPARTAASRPDRDVPGLGRAGPAGKQRPPQEELAGGRSCSRPGKVCGGAVRRPWPAGHSPDSAWARGPSVPGAPWRVAVEEAKRKPPLEEISSSGHNARSHFQLVIVEQQGKCKKKDVLYKLVSWGSSCRAGAVSSTLLPFYHLVPNYMLC